MTTVGFDRSLYVLPFDRRVFFQRTLSPDQTAQIAAAKQVIYDGFRTAVAAGVPKEKAGILVDEQFGRAVLRDAAAEGYTLACPAEKSGQGEFDFEYGEDFARHIEAFHPTFCKVLVRYNPEGDQTRNRRQAERLKRLSYYLHEKSTSLFMFELLVPAEKFQLDGLQGNLKAYDLWLRPRLMVQAIEQLQDGGVEPDIWKVERLDRREDCRKIVAAARRGPDQGLLHRSRAGRRREQGEQVADDGCQCPRLHRLHGRREGLQGAASRMAARENHAGRRSRGDRGSIPAIRGHLRASPRRVKGRLEPHGGHNAARNDRIRPHGREHDAAAPRGWPPMRRLR